MAKRSIAAIIGLGLALSACAGIRDHRGFVIDPTLAATPLFHTGFRQEHADAIVNRALRRVGELGGSDLATDSRRAAILVYAGRAAPDESLLRRGLEADPDSPDAMVALARSQPFYGLKFEGRSFDCGSKIGFLAANVAYALQRDDIAPELRAEMRRLLDGK